MPGRRTTFGSVIRSAKTAHGFKQNDGMHVPLRLPAPSFTLKRMETERTTAKPSVKDGTSEITLTCNVGRVHKRLLKRVQARFPESDRSFEEWMALRLFADGLVETAGDLARECGIATGATTRLIDSLEEQGFIERDGKNGDRRVVVLRLTRKGASHYKKKLPDLLACWHEVLADWKKDEVNQLTTLLTKLQASLARNTTR